MIEQTTIAEAARRLLAFAPQGSEVFLFGLYARGDALNDSDLDFPVVEPALVSRRDEMVRLREAPCMKTRNQKSEIRKKLEARSPKLEEITLSSF